MEIKKIVFVPSNPTDETQQRAPETFSLGIGDIADALETFDGQAAVVSDALLQPDFAVSVVLEHALHGTPGTKPEARDMLQTLTRYVDELFAQGKLSVPEYWELRTRIKDLSEFFTDPVGFGWGDIAFELFKTDFKELQNKIEAYSAENQQISGVLESFTGNIK